MTKSSYNQREANHMLSAYCSSISRETFLKIFTSQSSRAFLQFFEEILEIELTILPVSDHDRIYDQDS